jgi:hypothetical protein
VKQPCQSQWRTQDFFEGGGGVQQIQLRLENREWGSGGGSPLSGVPLNLQMNETNILIRLLQLYIPRNWKFGSALAKFRGGGLNPPSVRHWSGLI